MIYQQMMTDAIAKYLADIHLETAIQNKRRQDTIVVRWNPNGLQMVQNISGIQ